MGNTSEIYRRKGKITKDEVKKTLDDINRELFDNKLPIFIYDTNVMFINDDADLVWWLEDKPHVRYDYDEKTDTSTGYEDADNFIEYRDVPRLRTSAWLNDVLTKEFSKRLKLINFCSAIDEEMTDSSSKSFEDYSKRFGTVSTGVKGFLMSSIQRKLYKEDLKWAKKVYPKELYDYLFDKHFKLK